MADIERITRYVTEGVSLLSSFEQEARPVYRAQAYRTAIARVIRELAAPESRGILVYGDYDMDGMGGGVILHR